MLMPYLHLLVTAIVFATHRAKNFCACASVVIQRVDDAGMQSDAAAVQFGLKQGTVHLSKDLFEHDEDVAKLAYWKCTHSCFINACMADIHGHLDGKPTYVS